MAKRIAANAGERTKGSNVKMNNGNSILHTILIFAFTSAVLFSPAAQEDSTEEEATVDETQAEDTAASQAPPDTVAKKVTPPPPADTAKARKSLSKTPEEYLFIEPEVFVDRDSDGINDNFLENYEDRFTERYPNMQQLRLPIRDKAEGETRYGDRTGEAPRTHINREK
jgi:hypothetical protein